MLHTQLVNRGQIESSGVSAEQVPTLPIKVFKQNVFHCIGLKQKGFFPHLL